MRVLCKSPRVNQLIKAITVLLVIAFGLVQGCATHQRSSLNKEEKFNAGDIVRSYIMQFDKDRNNMLILNESLKNHLKTNEIPELLNVTNIKKFGNMALARADMKTAQYGRRVGWIAFQIENGKIEQIVTSFKLPDNFRYEAELGQSADIASTAIGLSSGLVEGNPIMSTVIDSGGIPALAAIKLGATTLIKRSGINTCSNNLGGLAGAGAGAAVWNLGLIAGIGPISIVPAFTVGMIFWDDKDESFWDCMPQEVVDYVISSEKQIVMDDFYKLKNKSKL